MVVVIMMMKGVTHGDTCCDPVVSDKSNSAFFGINEAPDRRTLVAQ